MSETAWIQPTLLTNLQRFLVGDVERVGFVLPGGELVECSNICADPAEGFDVSDADLQRYGDDAVGTWHTHPGGTKLLSVGDYETFLANDELVHFIIADDGVAAYVVEGGVVLNRELPE